MSIQLAVRLSAEELTALDEMVALSRFPTRAAAIRHALGLLLRAERERGIEAAYERGYGSQPQRPTEVRRLDDALRTALGLD